MAFTARMEMRLGQALVMTPQLQQAIKLLQMPNVELAVYVEEQIEKNPLLEQASDDWGGDDAGGEKRGEGDAPAPQEALAPSDEVIKSDQLSAEKQDALDAEPGQIYAEDGDSHEPMDDGAGRLQDWSGGKGATSGFEEWRFDLEGTLSEPTTLREHLLRQLQTSALEGAQRAIGAYLVEYVDESGYLTDDLASIAQYLGASCEEVEGVLTRVQDFEPTGVFSRSLSECLSLQLQERNRLDPPMRALMQNLEHLARRELPQLCDLCDVDMPRLLGMIKAVRELNPKPGLIFGGEIAETVVPDVYVAGNPDGSWRIELNTNTLPKVLVNQRYYAEIASSAKGAEAKTFIDNCFADASWLVKSLDQRARTILKVVAEIVQQQEAFLQHGVHHLKPLNLKTVADAIGMHESTVSRVTSCKYVATPRGVLELKYFFTSAIASADGSPSHSAESVRHRIRKMIDDENPNAILSDDRIVEILRGSDIDIARRTIVKYRESMKIPSSIQRRRQKGPEPGAAFACAG
jgi:RNA polymerase sigma-54 factor